MPRPVVPIGRTTQFVRRPRTEQRGARVLTCDGPSTLRTGRKSYDLGDGGRDGVRTRYHVGDADGTEFNEEHLEGATIQSSQIRTHESSGGTIRVGSMKTEDGVIGVQCPPHLTQIYLLGCSGQGPTPVHTSARLHEANVAQLPQHPAHVHRISTGTYRQPRGIQSLLGLEREQGEQMNREGESRVRGSGHGVNVAICTHLCYISICTYRSYEKGGRMTTIAVIGISGYVGGHIANEALRRGLDVIGVSRTGNVATQPGLTRRTGDIADPTLINDLARNASVLVVATHALNGDDPFLVDLVPSLLQAVSTSDARLGVVGGAGSLFVSSGTRLFDSPDFPEQFRGEAKAHAAVLEALQASTSSADWFYVSPAAGFGSYAPGERTGHFRVGGDTLLSDDEGNSFISGADFAVAFVDEIETPRHHRQRWSVAY